MRNKFRQVDTDYGDDIWSEAMYKSSSSRGNISVNHMKYAGGLNLSFVLCNMSDVSDHPMALSKSQNVTSLR